jgi:hypothetical protein
MACRIKNCVCVMTGLREEAKDLISSNINAFGFGAID